MSQCLLDWFPVEILHTIFSYLLAHEILLSFSNVTPHLDAILLSYSDYRCDFTSILKHYFDLVCHRIRPDQVTSLALSDEEHTPGQSKLFLSRFRMEQFARLRSLKFVDVQNDSLEIIFRSLNKLNGLRMLSVDISPNRDDLSTIDYSLFPFWWTSYKDSITCKPIPISRLQHLKIGHRILDDFEYIFKSGSNLQSLHVDVVNTRFDIDAYEPLTKITRFVLEMNCKYTSIFSTSISNYKLSFSIWKAYKYRSTEFHHVEEKL